MGKIRIWVPESVPAMLQESQTLILKQTSHKYTLEQITEQGVRMWLAYLRKSVISLEDLEELSKV